MYICELYSFLISNIHPNDIVDIDIPSTFYFLQLYELVLNIYFNNKYQLFYKSNHF